MATAVFDSPVREIDGESITAPVGATHYNVKPGFHEVAILGSHTWKMALAPKLARVFYYNGTTYTDRTSNATDRATTTVSLSEMAATHYLYLGTTSPTRGFYFTMSADVNDVASTLSAEYCYDISTAGYMRLTGTGTGALTVGETVTGDTSGATATLVYYNSAYIVVKGITGRFVLGEDVDGASQSCNVLTGIAHDRGIGYFTAVASASDGTMSGSDTLKQSGLFSFTLPSVVTGAIDALDSQPLCWYRFAVSATLDADTAATQITPAAAAASYGFFGATTLYRFSLNAAKVGAIEVLRDGGTDSVLSVAWIKH